MDIGGRGGSSQIAPVFAGDVPAGLQDDVVVADGGIGQVLAGGDFFDDAVGAGGGEAEGVVAGGVGDGGRVAGDVFAAVV